MHRIFLDLDGVIVDFDGFCVDRQMAPEDVKRLVGAYQTMKPMPGAIEGVRALISMGYEVWLATKPPTGVAHAYGDKAQWVFDHLPELSRRLILTHDKGMLGDRHDFLIDDRPHRANCKAFDGTLLHFGKHGTDWPMVVNTFRVLAKPLGKKPARTGDRNDQTVLA